MRIKMLKHDGVFQYEAIVLDIHRTMAESPIENKRLSTWISLVEKNVDLIGIHENEEMKQNLRNKYRGDMLEIFAEFFFRNQPLDNRFGLKDYTLCDPSKDYGCDATGINCKGKKCAVQIKYRANPMPKGDDQITYNMISNTVSDGLYKHQCDLFEPDTIFLLTTASRNSLAHTIDDFYGNHMVYLCKEQLESVVNGHEIFWQQLYATISDSIN
jgi:hypothetical protein